MNLKKIVFLGLTTMVLFGACGKEEKTVTTKENDDCRVSWWGGEDRHKTIEAIKLFEQAHPNITVKQNMVDGKVGKKRSLLRWLEESL